MAIHNCATDAELNTAFQNSVGGDSIKLTVSRDYTMAFANGYTKSSTVTVSNNTGIDARIKVASTGFTSSPTRGFRDCTKFTFSGIRMAENYWFSCDDIRFEGTTHTGMARIHGDSNRVTFDGCIFRGFANRAISIDGRQSGTSHTPTDITVQNCAFSELGEDCVFIVGGSNILIQDNTMTDISSYHFGPDQTASRQHSDGIQCVQVDGLTIRRNRLTRIEWAGIIIQRQGHDFGFTGANTKLTNILIENNILSQIGSSYCTVPQNIPNEQAGGGTGIQLVSNEIVTVSHNTLERLQAAGINFYKGYNNSPSTVDPNYDGTEFVGRFVNNTMNRARNTAPTSGQGQASQTPTLWHGNKQEQTGQTDQYNEAGNNNAINATLTYEATTFRPLAASAAYDGGVESATGVTLPAADINSAAWLAGRDVGAVIRTAASAGSSIAVVQTKSNHGASQTTLNVVPDATPIVGNKLILIAAMSADVVPNTPSGWTAIHTVGPSATMRQHWFEKESAGTESTITVTTPTAAGYSLLLYEISGLTDATAEDQSTNPTASSTVTSHSAGTTGTLAQANEIAIAVCRMDRAFSAESWSNSFTAGPATTVRAFSAYKIVSETTAVSTTASWTTSAIALAAIVTFKGGSTVVTTRRAASMMMR